MNVVADTNILISGMLWLGPPQEVMDAARAGLIRLFTTEALIAELHETLRRPKFAARLHRRNLTADHLVEVYRLLAEQVRPATIHPTVHDDPDDDEVLACAVAADAYRIVSGDRHLLALRQYRSIRIVTATELLADLKQ